MPDRILQSKKPEEDTGSIKLKYPLDPGNQVNDFFSNGHFLEAALPPLPPPLTHPPPVTTAGLMVVRTQAPPQQQAPPRQQTPPRHLIRPKNLSTLQASPHQRLGPPALRLTNPPALVRKHMPTILRPAVPGQYQPRRQYTPLPQTRFRGPSTPRTGNPSFFRTPQMGSLGVRKSPITLGIASQPAPTADWFDNMLDQALLSADFYKDEIIKLKLNNMSLHRKNNVNMSTDPSVLNTVRTLNWVMKSMLEQGLDIRRAIAKQYPKTESTRESLNMERLHNMKGVPFFTATVTNHTPSPNLTKTVVKTVSPATKTVSIPHPTTNGNSDVVDLVSDDEDNHVISKQNSQLTISPVKRISLPVPQRSPLTPTPSNRLSVPLRRRRKKNIGDSDDSDDDDYVPSATSSMVKKRKKYMLNNTSPSPSQTKQHSASMSVTNVRSLQEGKL